MGFLDLVSSNGAMRPFASFLRFVVPFFLWMVASGVEGASFAPDPNAVQRFGKGYKYPQKGWMVVHIEGAPYERGEQHGRLLADEIAGYARCLAASFGSKTQPDAWEKMRRFTAEFMLPHYPPELLEEMRGIAEGATAAGATIEDRELDATDVAVLNAANEIDMITDAVEATPGGLEGLNPSASLEAVVRAFDPLPETSAMRPVRRSKPARCSAFVANGKATKDGKIVFGHITMYDLYQANFYNVWLDVSPAEGFRFAMQTTPAGIHSGMDFTMNAAGLLLSETTVQQTAFDPAGKPLAIRIREASQYADSVEKAAAILSRDGNGLVSTEWILGDVQKNEIALLTLGFRKQVLRRSSQREWLEGMEGFFWSCNNTKDMGVRLETVPGNDSRPSSAAVFEPTKRDVLWLQLYRSHAGKIDADFARKALSTPALVSAFSVDAVFTTSDLASGLKAWGAFGPPVGGIRFPSAAETVRFPEILPLLPNPWTLLDAAPPRNTNGEVIPVDLSVPEGPDGKLELDGPVPGDKAVRYDKLPRGGRDPARVGVPPEDSKEEAAEQSPSSPAWTGTLIPATDSDTWLAAAFAHYEKIVSLSQTLDSNEEFGVELNYYRSMFGISRLRSREVPLTRLKPGFGEQEWYRMASGKGVLLLHQLRELAGRELFDSVMADFGRRHAGKPVSGDDLRREFEARTPRDPDLNLFFKEWLEGMGLPRVELAEVKVSSRLPDGPGSLRSWVVNVGIKRVGQGAGPVEVPVTVEHVGGSAELTLTLTGKKARQSITLDQKPSRVILDKHGTAGLENGHPFTVLSFEDELEETWIVYGTLGDSLVNAEAARLLRGALGRREHNISVPVKADFEVKKEDLKGRHLVLVGRPDTHRLLGEWEKELPVRFGKQSLEVDDDVYAHPATALVLAERNPADERYSIVVLAGISGLGTIRVAPMFEEEGLPFAQTVILPYQRATVALTLPPKNNVRELE